MWPVNPEKDESKEEEDLRSENKEKVQVCLQSGHYLVHAGFYHAKQCFSKS